MNGLAGRDNGASSRLDFSIVGKGVVTCSALGNVRLVRYGDSITVNLNLDRPTLHQPILYRSSIFENLAAEYLPKPEISGN